MSLALMPVLITSALVLLVINPFKNTGPLFFTQKRMGKNCEPFTTIKFRSMTPIKEIARGADDPIERNA